MRTQFATGANRPLRRLGEGRTGYKIKSILEWTPPSVLCLCVLLSLQVDTAWAGGDSRLRDLLALADRYCAEPAPAGAPAHQAFRSQQEGNSLFPQFSAVALAPDSPLPGRASAASGFLLAAQPVGVVSGLEAESSSPSNGGVVGLMSEGVRVGLSSRNDSTARIALIGNRDGDATLAGSLRGGIVLVPPRHAAIPSGARVQLAGALNLPSSLRGDGGAAPTLEIEGALVLGTSLGVGSGAGGAPANGVGRPAVGTAVGTGSAYLAVNSSGTAAAARGAEGVALGAGSLASGARSVALGYGALALAEGSVALGAGSVAERAGAVSVGAAGAERQLVHMADASAPTDAVNLRQLQASERGAVQYARDDEGNPDYSAVVLGRPTANAVQLRNVAAARESHDAVNYAQLNQALGQNLDAARAYADDRFFSLGGQIRRVDDRASAGIASALAVAGLPQPYTPGSNMASVAVGGFNGEGGMAVGISGVTESGRWIYRLSGTTNTRGEGGMSLGAGIQW